MKNQLFTLAALLLLITACQPATEKTTEQAAEAAAEEADQAAFNQKTEVIKSFIKAHSDEDLEALEGMLSDTLKWSPPFYNGDEWLGKEDYLAALGNYHNDYEQITFHEGIAGIDDTAGAANGFWSGSVYPESLANTGPAIIRMYGTWTAIHTETGKEVGVKWYGLSWVNDAGQIARWTEYFDVHGLAAQIAEE